MSLSHTCPGCTRKFTVSPQLAAQLNRCPECGARWRLTLPAVQLPPASSGGGWVVLLALLFLSGAGVAGWLIRHKPNARAQAETVSESDAGQENRPPEPPGPTPAPKDEDLSPSHWAALLPDEKASRELLSRGAQAVPVLRQTLRSSNPEAQRSAAGILGQLGCTAEAAVPDLIGLLDDREKKIRLAAIAALGGAGKGRRADVLAALLPLLSDADEQVHPAVLKTLDGVGRPGRDDGVLLRGFLEKAAPARRAQLIVALGKLDLEPGTLVPLLAGALQDEATTVRSLAAQGLGNVGPAARVNGFRSLLGLLKDTDEEVVRAATQALARIGEPAAQDVPFLADVLERGSLLLSARVYAAGGLRRAGKGERKRVLRPLMAALRDDRAALRRVAAAALRDLGPPDVSEVPLLALALESARQPLELRLYAAWAVGERGRAAVDSGPALVAALRDRDRSLRRAAAAALARVRPRNKATVAALAQALDEDDPELRLQVTVALGQLHTVVGAFDGLLRALQDEDAEVIGAAAAGLDRLGRPPKEAVVALAAALAARPVHVRIYAAHALARMGADAEEAVPALARAIEDENPAVAVRALLALKAVGPGAAVAVPALVAALEGDSPALRVHAAAALVAANKQLRKAVPLLLMALNGSARELRPVAAAAVRALGPESAGAALPLVAALREGAVREPAARALIRMGKTGVPEIADLLKEADPELRLLGVQILSQIGPPARAAFRPLSTLFQRDPVPDIRRAARDALKLIQMNE